MILSENSICWLGFLAALVVLSSHNPHQLLAQFVALANAGATKSTKSKKNGRSR